MGDEDDRQALSNLALQSPETSMMANPVLTRALVAPGPITDPARPEPHRLPPSPPRPEPQRPRPKPSWRHRGVRFLNPSLQPSFPSLRPRRLFPADLCGQASGRSRRVPPFRQRAGAASLGSGLKDATQSLPTRSVSRRQRFAEDGTATSFPAPAKRRRRARRGDPQFARGSTAQRRNWRSRSPSAPHGSANGVARRRACRASFRPQRR